jgi:hypothetical protein
MSIELGRGHDAKTVQAPFESEEKVLVVIL